MLHNVFKLELVTKYKFEICNLTSELKRRSVCEKYICTTELEKLASPRYVVGTHLSTFCAYCSTKLDDMLFPSV